MYEQVLELGAVVEIEEVLEIIPGEMQRVITDMGEHEAKCIIIASGSSNRLLGLDREIDFIGNGISFCTICDGAFYKDKVVAVVGGGNTALVDALSLAHLCKKIYVLVRKDSFKGDKKRIDEVMKTPNIEVMFQTVVKKIRGNDSLEGVIIETNSLEKELKVECIFEAIGQDANTAYLKKMVDLSEQLYIISDKECKTNIPGIFACGDVLEKNVRQLTTAVSDGTVAAISAIQYLNEKR